MLDGFFFLVGPTAVARAVARRGLGQSPRSLVVERSSGGGSSSGGEGAPAGCGAEPREGNFDFLGSLPASKI